MSGYTALSESYSNFANPHYNKSYICAVRVADMFKLHKLQIYRVKPFPKAGLTPIVSGPRFERIRITVEVCG